MRVWRTEADRSITTVLLRSDYPAIRKFCANLRAAEWIKIGPGHNTNTPPEVHGYRRAAMANLLATLEDQTTPIGEAVDACLDLLRVVEANKKQYGVEFHPRADRVAPVDRSRARLAIAPAAPSPSPSGCAHPRRFSSRPLCGIPRFETTNLGGPFDRRAPFVLLHGHRLVGWRAEPATVAKQP